MTKGLHWPLTGRINSTRGVKTAALLFHPQIGVNSTFFVCCEEEKEEKEKGIIDRANYSVRSKKPDLGEP